MVGNAWEWVGDWADLATGCTEWPSDMGDDVSCVGANATGIVDPVFGQQRHPAPLRIGLTLPAPPPLRLDQRVGVRKVDIYPISPNFPAPLFRGGNYAIGARSGVFAIHASGFAASQSRSIGFRCAR
jgi:hypothetical protein